MANRGDDLGVLIPLLLFLAVIFGLGIYNEFKKAFISPSEAEFVRDAEEYSEQAERDLRRAIEENGGRFDAPSGGL